MTRAARQVAKEIADKYLNRRCWDDDEEGKYTEVWRKDMERWLLLLAPPQKRRVVSKGTKARRATVKELDALCREVVFKRDGYCCRKCYGLTRLQWCHVYSRRYKWLRWEPDNSFCGCAGCHLEWHHKPTEGAEWWKKELGLNRYMALALKAGKPQKADLDKWKLYLLQEKKKLEAR